MSLIKCPECGKEISEYAVQCGHCFYPLRERNAHTATPAPKIPRIRNGKPSRNSNGTGSITHLKGNLHKPFKVTITTGWEYDIEKDKTNQTDYRLF